MMLAGFLFLLLLTDGSTSSYSEHTELPDDQQKSNQSFEEDGSTSSYSEKPELLDNLLKSSESSDEGGQFFDYQHFYYYDDGAEDEVSTKLQCGYDDVLKFLNLTKNNELYTSARPVKHFKTNTSVCLTMEVYDVLDVREIDQTLVLHVWIYMSWPNEHIGWHPPMFCGLQHIVVPSALLWKPDLIIEEVTEKNKAPPSPYIAVRFHGLVELANNQVLVSTCRIQVYKFPFDIQSCTLSFKSALHNDKEIKFEAMLDASKIKVMENQYEWLFVNMTVKKMTVKQKTSNVFKYNQSMVVYTITMRRRSALYMANFILPILFFFCLDLASFLISDSGGEKLSFKVTVLLAVTVMQLILNDILPSSDRIPLIAVFCIGIFGLMLLSLLETILVMYLIEKDFASQDNNGDKEQSLSEDCGDKQGKDNIQSYDGEMKKWTHCACIFDVFSDEPPSDLLSVAKEGSSSQTMEKSHTIEQVSDELKAVQKTLTLLLNSRKGEGRLGYWTRVSSTGLDQRKQ
ncbi:5-hydroxytryptamine receptor 3A-like [Epinephelus fuscoguttatus]|uniref:5-hydroxytryptamine receptor 3A-like n=1 Tax=Epinephelus fuscoguttatus TaxID=293821 RepID=UPI0020D1D4BA|nr:5-hydroxytryptamine receptor 3A-like [Epinephelus fuscoguttatus]